MKTIINKRKNYKNILNTYNIIYSRQYIKRKNPKDISIDIKFPMFLYKVTFFRVAGLMVRKHKRNLNSTMTIIFKLSRNKIKLNFPFNNGLIKFN